MKKEINENCHAETFTPTWVSATPTYLNSIRANTPAATSAEKEIRRMALQADKCPPIARLLRLDEFACILYLEHWQLAGRERVWHKKRQDGSKDPRLEKEPIHPISFRTHKDIKVTLQLMGYKSPKDVLYDNKAVPRNIDWLVKDFNATAHIENYNKQFE